MKVFLTLSAALRLAFWLFVLGMVLGVALRLPAAGETRIDNAPVPPSVDARMMPAPVNSAAERGW